MTATSKALVGPVHVVRFHGGPDGAQVSVICDPPKSTMDPRWITCAAHRVACDCREAELAEEITELRAMLKAAAEAAREVCVGHATWAYETDCYDGTDREIGCMCTGCQIIRRAHLLAGADAGPYARSEARNARRSQAHACGHNRYRVGALTLEPRDGDRWLVTDGQHRTLGPDGAWLESGDAGASDRNWHRWDDALRLAEADPRGGAGVPA